MRGAEQRCNDQLWMLGEQHGALMATIQRAAAWSEAAAAWTHSAATEVVRRALGTKDSARLLSHPLPVMSLEYADLLDAIDAQAGDAALEWQAWWVERGVGDADALTDLGETLQANRRDNRGAAYRGDATEGDVLHQWLAVHGERWRTQVADAPHFIADAGVPLSGLNEYVASMTALLASAEQLLHSARTDLGIAVSRLTSGR